MPDFLYKFIQPVYIQSYRLSFKQLITSVYKLVKLQADYSILFKEGARFFSFGRKGRGVCNIFRHKNGLCHNSLTKYTEINRVMSNKRGMMKLNPICRMMIIGITLLFAGCMDSSQQIENSSASLWSVLNAQVIDLYEQGDYSGAEAVGKEALDLAELTFGTEHLSVATSLNNLAMVYTATERYGSAETLYKRSLNIREKEYGKNHLEVARVIYNLSLAYKAKGDFDKALPLINDVLRIRTEKMGAEDLNLAPVLDTRGDIYLLKSDLFEAEQDYERSLSLREDAVGSNHPEIIESTNRLGALFYRKGELAYAEANYLRGLYIARDVLQTNSALTARQRNLLVDFYKGTGQSQKAAAFEEAAAIDDAAVLEEETVESEDSTE